MRNFAATLRGVIRHVIAVGQRQGVMRGELPLEETSGAVVSAMVKEFIEDARLNGNIIAGGVIEDR